MLKLRQFLMQYSMARRIYDIYLIIFRHTFFGGRMATCHNADFLTEQRFQHAYRYALGRGNYGYAWHIKIFCWAVQQATGLDGDFVECGTNRGSSVAAALEYVGWNNRKGKIFYLFDTFSGVVKEQVTSADKGSFHNRYVECYDEVNNYFSNYTGVKLVRGVIPESLADVKIDKVAFLHLDLNCATPEKAALEYFWPRMVTGGIILLDDYGWRGYENQKMAHDEFALSVGHEVLPLPTGQGMIIRR